MTRPWMPIDGPLWLGTPPPTEASSTLAIIAVMALAALLALFLTRHR